MCNQSVTHICTCSVMNNGMCIRRKKPRCDKDTSSPWTQSHSAEYWPECPSAPSRISSALALDPSECLSHL